MVECKRCLLIESACEDTFKAVREHIEKIPEGKRADEKLYAERLEKCRQCEALISGTCIKCGCYVELRAAFTDQRCPNAKNRKW